MSYYYIAGKGPLPALEYSEPNTLASPPGPKLRLAGVSEKLAKGRSRPLLFGSKRPCPSAT